MAIEAPLSRYKRSNYKIWIASLTALAAIFAYDGFLSRYEWSHRTEFYEEHMRMHAFDLAEGLAGDLVEGPVSPPLREAFEGAKVTLSAGASVSVVEPDRRWVINDGQDGYPILKEQTALAVYRIGPDGIMLFNRISPLVFMAVALILVASFWRCKGDRVVAEENELILSGRERISYDAVERIDKTHFQKKGFFTVVYRANGDTEVTRKLSDRQYDNLGAILDHLVSKIT